jgi:hypothetical protein
LELFSDAEKTLPHDSGFVRLLVQILELSVEKNVELQGRFYGWLTEDSVNLCLCLTYASPSSFVFATSSSVIKEEEIAPHLRQLDYARAIADENELSDLLQKCSHLKTLKLSRRFDSCDFLRAFQLNSSIRRLHFKGSLSSFL